MAGKIYVTGDCHGTFSKFNTSNFALQKGLDKDDYVIICGDFGGIWSTDIENREENTGCLGLKISPLQRCLLTEILRILIDWVVIL